MFVAGARESTTLRERLTTVVLFLVLAGLTAASAAASRPATKTETRKIAAEVHLTLSILADSPDAGIRHGLHVVLAPICVSTVDPRYAAAVANPIENGKVLQAGDVFLHRVPGGYRMLGGLRIGDQLAMRPDSIPSRPWADLEKHCVFLGNAKIKALVASHSAPTFVT